LAILFLCIGSLIASGVWWSSWVIEGQAANEKAVQKAIFKSLQQKAIGMNQLTFDYFLNDIKSCINEELFDYWNNENYNFLSGARVSEIFVNKTALVLEQICVKKFVLKASTLEESKNRNSQLSDYGLAPYSSTDISVLE